VCPFFAAFPFLSGLQVKKEMSKWEMHKQNWEQFKRGRDEHKATSKYLGVSSSKWNNRVSGWQARHKGQKQTFKLEEARGMRLTHSSQRRTRRRERKHHDQCPLLGGGL